MRKKIVKKAIFTNMNWYCPARWIWLKVVLFIRSSLKGEARGLLANSARLPCCDSLV
jgi:hypothetical protein